MALDRFPDLPDGSPAHLAPADVPPLNDADLAHILDGDGLGCGGHRSGLGVPGKTEFPIGWGDADVYQAVEAALRETGVPRRLTLSDDGVVLRALVREVIIEIPISDYSREGLGWEVSTAYPLSGDGVVRNLRSGDRQPVTLRMGDLTRTLDT
jgi:hypothetical protein